MTRVVSISWVRHHRRSAEMAKGLGVSPTFIRDDSSPLPRRYLRQWRKTVRLLKSESPDVVIVMQPPAPALWVASRYAARSGARILGDLHSGTFDDPRWKWATESVLRVLRRHGAALVPNEDLARLCEEAGVLAFVAPAYIEPTSFGVPAEPGAGHVLVPLAWAFDEPIDEILAAAAATPELQWVLTGKPKGRYRDLVPPDNVELSGFVSREEYQKLRAEAFVILAVTTKEGTMQSAGFEALASATPLVTSPTRVLRDYFGESALYAQPTASELSTKVRDAARDYPEWGARMTELRESKIADQEEVFASVRAWIGQPHRVPSSRK